MEVIKLLSNFLFLWLFLKAQIDTNAFEVIDSSLGIIFNISKENNIERFFDNDMSILRRYKKSEVENFVALATMILVHISNGEVEKIQDEKGTIRKQHNCI